VHLGGVILWSPKRSPGFEATIDGRDRELRRLLARNAAARFGDLGDGSLLDQRASWSRRR
jgi:hypothetical protein